MKSLSTDTPAEIMLMCVLPCPARLAAKDPMPRVHRKTHRSDLSLRVSSDEDILPPLHPDVSLCVTSTWLGSSNVSWHYGHPHQGTHRTDLVREYAPSIDLWRLRYQCVQAAPVFRYREFSLSDVWQGLDRLSIQWTLAGV